MWKKEPIKSDGLLVKGVPFVNRRYTKGAPFLLKKDVYKTVRGRTQPRPQGAFPKAREKRPGDEAGSELQAERPCINLFWVPAGCLSLL